MSVIIILLFASISVAGLFLAAFLWSVKNGQFSDEVSPPLRILLDNPISPENIVIEEYPINNISNLDKQPTIKTTN
jgi:cbb3-type cytochrome oxidase maturation protein